MAQAFAAARRPRPECAKNGSNTVLLPPSLEMADSDLGAALDGLRERIAALRSGEAIQVRRRGERARRDRRARGSGFSP